MFLSEPPPTNYDLSFSLFNFPIRVHPAFFIMPVLLGQGLAAGFENVGVGLLVVTIIFFVSILVHELGHAFAFRRFGQAARVVLYWMGGLAIPERGRWDSSNSRGLSSNEQIFVSFAGPLAGFLLAGAVIAVGVLMGARVALSSGGLIPLPLLDFSGTTVADSQPLILLFQGAIIINILLNLLNLVPIYPLDGGQIAYHFMVNMDPRDGMRNSIILSIAAAILMALIGFASGLRFMGFFFAFMAFSNFQRLQMSGPRW